MDNLSSTLASGFIRCYEDLVKRVHQLADSVPEEQFWVKPFPYGNSFGHLVLHITGNLNYYIGTQIARTGYVRNREREFTETHHRSKEEILKELDQAVALVISTIETQSVEDWSREYTASGEPDAGNRFNILLKCSIHFYHHIGQMIYLVKELARQR
jgi:uncharacterized damage-inducible protein DinB